MTVDTLRVKVFPGAQNLPFYAGLRQGLFEARGIALALEFTRNSVELRDDLAAGRVDVVHTAVDNAVAMHQSGQPIVVFMGGDSSMNEFFVQAGIDSFAELRGRVLIVDAVDTAYALQAEKILADRGMKAGEDYRVVAVGATYQREQALADNPGFAASILNPPYSLRGRARGMKSLGRVVDLIGRYQATGAFAMRDWFGRHQELIERYIAAYLVALQWSRDPANHGICAELLSQYLDLDADLARQTLDRVLEPGFGLTPDAALDREGFRNVLRWRAELGRGTAGDAAEDETRYVDLSCYERVMSRGFVRADAV